MDAVQIGECYVTLTETEKQIRRMLLRKVSWKKIHEKTRLSYDEIEEIHYKIKKMEMLNMGKITEEQRKEIYQRWMNGEKQVDLAFKYGVTAGCISMLIKDMNRNAEKLTQSDVEKPVDVVEVKQEAAETVITEPETANEPLPDAVVEAVLERREKLVDRIENLKMEMDEYQKQIDELEIWMKSHEIGTRK